MTTEICQGEEEEDRGRGCRVQGVAAAEVHESTGCPGLFSKNRILKLGRVLFFNTSAISAAVPRVEHEIRVPAVRRTSSR